MTRNKLKNRLELIVTYRVRHLQSIMSANAALTEGGIHWEGLKNKLRKLKKKIIFEHLSSFLTLQAFQLRSLGSLPLQKSTMTASQILTTALGGEPKDFNSVRLFCKYIFTILFTTVVFNPTVDL